MYIKKRKLSTGDFKEKKKETTKKGIPSLLESNVASHKESTGCFIKLRERKSTLVIKGGLS